MSRRGENIRKRKDGRWEGRYYVHNVLTEKKVSRSVYAKSYAEAKEKLAKAKMCEQMKNSQNALSVEVRFETVAEEWLEGIKKCKKYATYVKYNSIYEKHIREKVFGLCISQVDEKCLSELFVDGKKIISDSMQRSISCVVNQIFSYSAVHYHTKKQHYKCHIQKMKTANGETLNQAEQKKLLQYLYAEMDIYKLGILLCISTGLRLGEICALKWEDVDLRGKILYVNATVQRIAVKGYQSRTILLEGEPKSIFSKREIPLSEEMMKLLFSFYDDSKIYVINEDRPMEPRTYQNKFQKYLKHAGIGKKNFHALRHTFATNCINSGTDIKSLSEILGHSDVKITLNRYVHPTLETKRQHMNSLSVIYGQYLGQEA